MSAIEIRDLTKKFNDFVAVDSISLEIQEGELFGLLGPNGAGKTTTISMLSTILKPTSGVAKINEFNINDQDKVRRSIGIVFQDPSLDDELTGRENLDLHARLYHLPKALKKERIEEVLKLVGLESRANDQIKKYSGGMKRRLEIARGLLHHPKVLFLDEPTLGLDPQTRRSIWEYVERLNKEEKLTIILTTHYMEEADYLCDRIAIIDKGKIIALDTPENLKSVMGGDIITLDLDEPERLKTLLTFESIKEANIVDGKINLTVNNSESSIPEIVNVAATNNIRIKSVSLKKPTLEDVFIHFTGHSIREQEASDVDKLRTNMNMWRR